MKDSGDGSVVDGGAGPPTNPAVARPKRIQRSRAKGWKLPEGAVIVSRPTRWGNPFVVHDWQAALRAVFLGFRGDRAGQTRAAVWLYEQWLTGEWRKMKMDTRSWFQREVMTIKPGRPAPTIDDIRAALEGKDLCCWCRLDQPCHADILLKLANATTPNPP